MPFDNQDTFARIIAKATVLAQRYTLLLESRDKAQAKANELQAALNAKEKELQDLRNEVEYLKMAAVLAPDRDQIESTRAIISGLVREIDRCITDLND